jgi:hypothetical protein
MCGYGHFVNEGNLVVSGVEHAADERRRRAQASGAARIVAAVVFLLALGLLIFNGTGSGGDLGSMKEKTVTETTTGGGKPKTVKKTTSTETSSAEPDRSLVGRAFGGGAAPALFQILLAGLGAFAAGALVQRVWLGEYGVTVGPVSLPALPLISEPAATEAIDLITESPEFTEILGPGPRGPQPFPQFQTIHDERLSLLSIRIELEQRLRSLAAAAGLDEDIALTRLPTRIAHTGIFNEQAARGLRKLIEIGDRIAAGAKVDPEAGTKLRDRAFDVLYALGELRRRATQRKESV